jgi:uncharacterized BrkB/YihY/UPF0761 family membrane protein
MLDDNPIDTPWANAIGDLLAVVIPPCTAVIVVLASVYFFYIDKLSADLFSGIVGTATGFLLGQKVQGKA